MTQTWDSTPQTTTCLIFFCFNSSNKPGVPEQLKLIFSIAVVLPNASFIATEVLPNPLGYCSV